MVKLIERTPAGTNTQSLSASTGGNDTAALSPTTATESDGQKQQHQQKQRRQLLSCTKCRARKVKCDRTKPSSACCARCLPRKCHLVVAEGADCGPVQQSHRVKKLEAENKQPITALSSVDSTVASRGCFVAFSKSSSSRQMKPRRQDPADSLHFGSPSLFAGLQIDVQSRGHNMPRGADIYAPQSDPQPYPFATMWPAYPQTCIPALLACLPPKEELFDYLDAHQKCAQTSPFLHTPGEIARKEVEQFLSDSTKNAEMFPDMLALMFAALARGAQCGAFDKCGGKWVARAMAAEGSKGDVYIATAMQALRMASFMNRPTLLGIQALVMIGSYLTDSGRFLDAWTLFGTTIRLAQSIGLNRNSKYHDPTPPPHECFTRQMLWWRMLYMDQQYSMTLGRPLSISGIGDCPPPEPLRIASTSARLAGLVNRFTVLTRQILSSDDLTNAKIDGFTDGLEALWDLMPEMLQFNQSWLNPAREIPEWPLNAMVAACYAETHSYIILLSRQRLSNTLSSTSLSPPSGFSGDANTRPHLHSHPPIHPGMNFLPAPALTSIDRFSPIDSPSAPSREHDLGLSSSLAVLTAFLFFYSRVPAALIYWPMAQQALSACMLLLLDAIETDDLRNIGRVEQAYAVFVELERKGVHRLAGLAVEKVSWGLDVLRKRTMEQRQQPGPNNSEQEGREDGNGAGMRMEDTVVGNTGMFLLEDPGLQGFAPESFAPLLWDMTGTV